jgi:hypothetical protein
MSDRCSGLRKSDQARRGRELSLKDSETLQSGQRGGSVAHHVAALAGERREQLKERRATVRLVAD